MTSALEQLREKAQSQIGGTVVGRMIVNFHTTFRDVYGPDVMASNLCAVGPLQSMIGLAIQNGQITLPASVSAPATELVEPVAWRARHHTTERWVLTTTDPRQLANGGTDPYIEAEPLYSAATVEQLRKELASVTIQRDEARVLAQMFSQADKKPEWIRRAEAAERQLSEALKALEDIEAEVDLPPHLQEALYTILKPAGISTRGAK